MTSLAWQGWLLESDSTRILADGVLVDEVGRGPPHTRLRFPFWPPRRFQFAQLPPIHAVWISHEHEDHFSLQSLVRIARDIPILMSSHMSIAAEAIARDLGFTVHRIGPGETVTIGDLTMLTFPADHIEADLVDEWDAMAYCVFPESRDGAFFTNVDVTITPAMRTAMNELAARGRHGAPVELVSFVAMELSLWASSRPEPTKPSEMHRVATAATPTLAGEAAVAALRAGHAFRPRAGQAIHSEAGRLASVSEATAFLGVAPPPWIAPSPFWPDPEQAIAPPRTGTATFSADDLPALERGLRGLARNLYCGPLFRQLLSLSTAKRQGRAPTFALVLMAGSEQAFAYNYELRACRFVPLGDVHDLAARYAGFVVLWASDLAALIRGEIEPRTIVQSMREHWIGACRERLMMELWRFFHPLRHPRRTLARYRKLKDELAGVEISVRAAAPAAIARGSDVVV